MDPTVLAWALVQTAGTRAAVMATAFTDGTTRVTFDGRSTRSEVSGGLLTLPGGSGGTLRA